MSSSTKKKTGTARIAWALGIQSRGLSIGLPVLYGDSYFSSYDPSKLPTIKSHKESNKTIELDGFKGHFINYSLRAAFLGLGQLAAKKSYLSTKFITVQFGEEFSKEIYKGTSSKTHTVNFANRLRRRFFSKLEITDYFFVLEKSGNGNLHMHLVTNITENSENEFKESLVQSNWIARSATGLPYSTAIHITNKYSLIMYRQAMTEDKAKWLDIEIEDPDFDSLWKCSKTRTLDERSIQCMQYERIEPNGLDVGLADYLSKKLTNKLFASGNWNYAISKSVKISMKPFIEQVLKEGKEISKS